MSVSLQKIAQWKSQQNPLEKVLGGGQYLPYPFSKGARR